jgi:hypothetical protein
MDVDEEIILTEFKTGLAKDPVNTVLNIRV